MYVVVGNKKNYYYYYYHIIRIWVNEIITTSAFRVDLEKSSAGSFKEPLLSSGWRERSCNVAARIMRWGGSPARALTSSDAIRDKDYA